jgi:shikimate kinase
MNRVYLIGIMGSGKTHLGRLLAQEMQLSFIDLDEEVAEKEGISVSAIFEQFGEDHFRLLEAAELRTTSLRLPDAVIACGGGTPCFHGNMDFMLKHGIVIWLHPEIETVVERIWKAKQKRPLIAKAETKEEVAEIISSIVEKRKPWYAQAHFTFTGTIIDLPRLKETIEAFNNLNPL